MWSRYKMKKLYILSGILFAALTVFAATAPEKIRKDQVQIGADQSILDKSIIFDTGDGVGNPSLTVEQSSRDFIMSNTLNMLEDLLKIGDGTVGANKVLEFDVGDGATNKKLQVDTSKDGSFNVNNFSLGDAATSDKQVIFDIGGAAANPRLQWDQSAQRLQFSNDGSTFKNIGAGGGGSGINILQDLNADCEAGSPPSNWTETGGSFTSETGLPGNGAQSCAWNPSITGQFLRSTLAVTPDILIGRTCTARVQTKWAGGVDQEIIWYVEDSSLGKLSLTKSVIVSSDWVPDTLVYTCPATGVTTRVVFESTADAANMIFDDVELGQSGVINQSQTELVAFAKYVGTTNCKWVRASATFGDFGVDADCPSITVDSSNYAVNTADNNLPDIDFSELPTGKYLVTAILSQSVDTAGQAGSFRISDGTNFGAEVLNQDQTSGNSTVISIKAVFDYSISAARNFKLQAKVPSGNVNIFNGIGSELHFEITKFPDKTAEAINFETTGWHIDANIGGDNPGLGLINQTSYVVIGSPTLDMVLNTGSHPAKIGCDASNPSTGLTCASGNETLGINFNIPYTGTFEACFTFGHSKSINASSSVSTTFQLIENGISDVIEGQLGKDRAPSLFSIGAIGANGQTVQPMKVCGLFNFTSVGEKRINLMYEQSVTGTPIASNVLVDRSGTQGQRDLHITVKPWNQEMPSPVFTDLTNSLAKKVEVNASSPIQRIDQVSFNCVASPTIFRQNGSWVSSITRNGTGDCTVNFSPSFGVTPSCTAMTTSGAFVTLVLEGGGSQRINIMHNTNVLQDGQVNMVCMGQK